MGYQIQNFVENQVLNSGHLNHIEDGIVALESFANSSLADKSTKSELQAESTRAKNAEQINAKNISDEIARAKAAEKANADNIAAEVERAQSAESALSTKITEETTRAEQAEQELDTRTAALESCGFVVVDGKVCMKYVKS
ncbi:MAG: hypothetical protein SOV03_03935 [Faecalibacterium sp.]|nr:hypothetical protein [Faecalibacterium sp.]